MADLTQKQVWDEIASDWNRFRETPREEVQGFIERCNGNLLDLGCGSGRHFLKKDGLRIYGVDFSEKMLDLAREKSIKNELNTELKLMNSEEIPFKDNFFDNVICIAVLHCVEIQEQRIKLLREIKRVLKKSGRAMIQVWSDNHKRVRNKGKEVRVPWTLKDKKVERFYYIYSLEELKQSLEFVGFNILRIELGENITAIVEKSHKN